MSRIDRRTFLKLSGQSTAVLGLGLSGFAHAQERGTTARKAAARNAADDEWEVFHPRVYNSDDAIILNKFQAQLDPINANKGNVNLDDLVSGKLNGRPGISQTGVFTPKYMATYYRRYGNNNPLFSDKEYAKKTKYGDVIAFPLILQPELWPAMNDSHGLADYMLVNGLNCTNNYYKPFYEGDSLYQVVVEQHYVDITPAAGSCYRTLALSGTARYYNQKRELVAESASILKESYRRHKDPAKRNPSRNRAWESPDWWQRKPHQYTDKDWETIIGVWKNETYRGADVLYWDDVNVGDEPSPRAAGPFLSDEVGTDMLFNIPDWSSNVKNDVLNPETFAKMVKNKQGIYVLPQYLEKKPKGQGSGNGMDRLEMPVSGELPQGGPPPQGGNKVKETPEIAHRDGRAVIQNSVCAKWVAGMIINWIGDQGWLERIGWDIMGMPPGYPESVVPPITKEMMPALFDKYPYLEKVPYMRGCRAAWHALEGDTILCNAYVTGKYSKGGKYFVDLIWWCQTLDKYLVEEGSATVKLPKRS
jgi:acyl dehydratase